MNKTIDDLFEDIFRYKEYNKQFKRKVLGDCEFVRPIGEFEKNMPYIISNLQYTVQKTLDHFDNCEKVENWLYKIITKIDAALVQNIENTERLPKYLDKLKFIEEHHKKFNKENGKLTKELCRITNKIVESKINFYSACKIVFQHVEQLEKAYKKNIFYSFKKFFKKAS